MNAFRSIRERLGVSQAVIASALGVTQSNVSFYEKGQTVPPAVASKLIEFARAHGLSITYDHVYGAAELATSESGVQRQPSEQPAACLTQETIDRAVCGAARHPYEPRGAGQDRRNADRRHTERPGRR